ncbi:MAG: FkbM family methyltransferase [Solirubrobacteraceae bacterium]
MKKAEIYDTLNAAYFSDEAHEQDLLAHLPLLLPDVRLAVDCGASLGQYTRALARLMRGGEIHAIEADPIRLEQLARNADLWSAKSDASIITHHFALTDSAGHVDYYVTNSDVSGGLERHDSMSDSWEQINVPAIRLDDLFPAAPDFIKIDVEGAELSVLRGAKRILSQGSPVLLIELHDWHGDGRDREVRKLMRDLGYKSTTFFDHAVFTKNPQQHRRLLALELAEPGGAKARLVETVKAVGRGAATAMRPG